MKAVLYFLGRALQLVGLLAMPSAIWVGQFYHNEAGAITIFTASLVVFFAGFGLTRAVWR